MARPFKHKGPQRPDRDKMVFRILRLLRGQKTSEIARKSGLSPGTISKWRTRRTRYPQHTSYEMALRAVNYRFEIVDENGNVVE